MYPYFRLAKVIVFGLAGRRQKFGDAGALRMFVWPTDIDVYPEMNNGRHLTLMDLGRFDLAIRSGLFKVVHQNGWSFVAAGASVRFRNPLAPLRFFALRTKPVGHDLRWFYFLQETVQGGKVCSSVLIRGGIRAKNGLVPAEDVLEAMGRSDWNPEIPDWVMSWIEADDKREMGGTVNGAT